MRPPRIPPMVRDLVQTTLSSFDGIEFTGLSRCPKCGGPLQGYDTRQKKFAVLREHDQEYTITVRVKRFTCKTCSSLCYADEPFYPDTRIGSPVVDIFSTLSTTMPPSRAARVIDAMGIVVDRTTWRNYAGRNFGDIPTADVFGMRLPFSLLSLSTLAARIPEGGRIPGAEALAACGFPSAQGASPDRPPAAEKGRKRDEEEDEEERQAQVPEENGDR
ncbi:MAG: hypothetical protein ABSB80_12515 [Methanoregula sp.]|uniref:hypothetical protein n=1 Tax=Methanoregula sp. TaxID=2052170 RepID=UPI003D1148D4